MSLAELFEKIGNDGSIRLKVWIESKKFDYIHGYLSSLEDLNIITCDDHLNLYSNLLGLR